ncbi:hypothetical protein PISL3812_02104 [Talaromyces islandicus]|uniref:Uncharacterized protein n=1 Tax=Talaromyces islandicus TaxID=28573 RepID=A0A0U1LNY5_TALIS|nr:hypothetical protein PISL3812_02104 [Talaromyces islandicus]
MNDLVDLVNDKIKDVVKAAGPQVVFVDWQGNTDTLKGRYSEPRVDETWDYENNHGISEDREETVFYEWETTKDDDEIDENNGHEELKKRQDITAPLNADAANATFEDILSFQVAIAHYVQQDILQDRASYAQLPDNDTYLNTTGSFLLDKYGRVFHPTKYGYSIIAKSIVNTITEEQAKLMNELAVTTTVGTSICTETTSVSKPTVSLTTNCHGVNGNVWVVDRDTAVDNAKTFCSQSDTTVEDQRNRYSQGTVNDLQFSAKNLLNPNQSISSAPDFSGNIIRGLIDGDGNDPINNFQNYKYGGNRTTADGWQFIFTPLHNQPDDDSCDASYKFWYDLLRLEA